MNITDRMGVALRGVQGQGAKLFQQFTPGGLTNTGSASSGIQQRLSNALSSRPRPQIIPARASALQLPPAGTVHTPGKTAAPHPQQSPTLLAISRGNRSIQAPLRSR